LHGLAVGLLLASALAPVAQADVTAVTVSTDRSDYVVGMTVSVSARIDFAGSFSQIDEPAYVEWFNASWVRVRAEYVAKSRSPPDPFAMAYASWAPTFPGAYRVNVSSNMTNGSPPTVFGSAAFTVWSPDEYVIALGVGVTTDSQGYERGASVTAIANFTSLSAWLIGNVSRLEQVQFNWYYPDNSPARLLVTVPVVNGEARDSWSPNLVGALYTVSVSYLGNDSVSNATGFPVFPPSTLAANVTAGQSVTWDAAQSPWRVCGDLLVAPTASLTIEPNVTVKFCRGSRLFVSGTLTGDGSPSAPILFTSYEFPPAPGDWNGIRFQGLGVSLLTDAIVEYVRDGIVAERSAPLLAAITLRQGTGEALNLTDSTSTVTGVSITGFSRGIHLRDANARVTNATIVGAAREGILAEGSAPSLDQIQIVGGTYSLRAVLVNTLQVSGASFASASIRAVDLTGTIATIANATISSTGQDFLIVASTATLLNCTFVDDPAERQIVTPSRLIVQNFLAVEVRTPAGSPVAGADVLVMKNGAQFLTRTTGPRGTAEWIVVEDRVHNSTGVAKNQIEIVVTKSGYSIEPARIVDMATSHTETFVATSLAGGPWGPALWAAIVGLLSVVLVGLLVRRRRSGPVAPSPTPAQRTPVAVSPGTAYAMLGEKPDAAFSRFAADIRSGSPGLCITRIHPEGARKRFGLDGVPVYWLSRSFAKDTLNPTNLGAIVDLVRKYTADKDECRVILDGLEYLYTQNDFGKIAKFVQALADVVAERRAVLLLPLDPRVLDADRLAILLRDLRTWP
jgi:hypothetical protein